jgi:predicted GIY-YIG superfamily endonuclease
MIGVYAFVPKGKLNPMYIGHSKNVQKRINEHFRNDRPFTTLSWILYQQFQNKEEAYLNEQFLIQKHKPWYNKTIRRDRIIPTPWECESIDDVLTGYENPPWRTQSLAMSAYYRHQKELFKKENQQ